MKTVIGFDSWTRGSRHFERLVPALTRMGYRLLLIHIGSWGHDKGRPQEEYIGELIVRDISYYRGKSLNQILLLEQPSAVIFLSTRAFTHMALNRYAASNGIPTCHLYHGLLSVQSISPGTTPYNINLLSVLALIGQRYAKNLFRLIPTYVKALFITRAPLKVWSYLLKEIYDKLTQNLYQIAPPDAKTSIGCVYAPSDVWHMRDIYGVAKKNIHIVGNPDLIYFDLQESDLNCCLTQTNNGDNIVYVDTYLVSAGIEFKSLEEYFRFLVSTRKTIRSLGYQLTLKLHPGHGENGLLEKLKDSQFQILETHNFIDTLKNARAVITEPSSLAIIPALLGLPLLLCKFGKLSSMKFGDALTSYPRARLLTRLEDLPGIIGEEQKELDIDNVMRWAEANSGPMPAKEMPARVANAIDQAIKQREMASR